MNNSGHPYVELVRRLTAAYTAQDRATIEALIASECVWRVPGQNVLSGVYRGRDGILELFRRMKRIFGPIEFEIIDIAANDRGAAVVQYASAHVGDTPVRLKECLVYTITDGRVVEMDEYQFDLRQFDEMLSADRLGLGPVEEPTPSG